MIVCELDAWEFADQASYDAHIPWGDLGRHINPVHVENLHWTGESWEIIREVLSSSGNGIVSVSGRRRV